MKSITIREKLHRFVDNVEEKRAKAIYTLFEDEIENELIEYDDEFKADLDNRIEYFRSGGKMVTPEEMNERLDRIKYKKAK